MQVDYKKDIYFDPRLGQIYAQLEGGIFHEYFFENAFGKIRHQFIIRPIDFEGYDLEERGLGGYFDLTSVYGYGGPVILSSKEGREKDLVQSFKEDFSAFCKEHRIVSEFVRFHPLGKDWESFCSLYEVKLANHTLGINLADYDDPFQEEFSKSARKSVRQGLRQGLHYVMEEYPDSLVDFADVYYQTMDRKDADDRYYFGRDYFDAFVLTMPEHVLKCRILFEGKTIAMGFYLRSHDILHAHLSGTVTDYLHLSPAYILRYALVDWGKAHGYKLIHTGGGLTGSPDDPLYLFKKKFSQKTEYDFYLGTKIWNEEVYKKIVNLTETEGQGFFPNYRTGG